VLRCGLKVLITAAVSVFFHRGVGKVKSSKPGHFVKGL